MVFRIPSNDCFRRLAHGVLIFLLWQAACRNTTALAFRSGFYLARKSPGIPQSQWPNTCCPSKRNPQKADVYLQFRRRSESPSRKTSLGMGLRDLLKRRILGRKDDKDGNNEETEGNDDDSPSVPSGVPSVANAVSPNLETPTTPTVGELNKAVQEEPAQKPPKVERRVVRMAEDPSTGEVNVQKRFGVESVQEKINRVKAGKMTDEEKEAFLRTALSAGDTPLSRPPLLQKKGGVKDDLDTAQRARGKASPFPTDTIIRKSFSLGRGGNNMTTSRDPSSFDSSLDTQKKKREYLDMVTNPDRFRTYKAIPSGGGASSTKSTPSTFSDVVSDQYDDGDDSYFPSPSLSSSRNNPFVDSSTAVPPPNLPPMPTDLGARLGAHALASEKIAADLRRQAEEDRREKERVLEEERREQEIRNQEAMRQREAELLRREREVAERKRAQEEALRKAEEERKRKEEERLRVMMQAQEEYWAKKLQAERSARQPKPDPAVKGAKPAAESSAVQDSTIIDDGAPLEVLSGAGDEAEQQKDAEQPTIGSPLNDVARPRSESQPSPWSWPQRTAADILGRNPRKAVAATNSLSDFQAEQARKKAEIERTKAMQLERLKALNSPIPNRPAAARGVTPTSGAFQPQYPASSSSSRGLGAALSRTTQQQPPPQQQSQPQPVKDDSLDDIFPPTTPSTTQRASNSWGVLNDVVRPATTSVSRPAPTPPSRPAAPAPVAAVKPDFSSKTSSPWGGLGNNAPAKVKKAEEVVAKTETAEIPSAPKSKGPVIRQQLPFDDEDGIGRDAKGLSIAEVMKRVKKDDGDGSDQQDRSKKWGVDMSRFRDK